MYKRASIYYSIFSKCTFSVAKKNILRNEIALLRYSEHSLTDITWEIVYVEMITRRFQ